MSWSERAAQILDGLLQRLARWLAPAMPWLHLLLRRAGLATLFWVAALVLFMGVPQSREVLRGLVLTASGSGPSPWSLAAYLVSSVLMATGLWHAARLLVTVDAAAATPLAWLAGVGMKRLQVATTWLPRLLGASAMAVAMGALMFALLKPPLGQWHSLALVVAALAGPLLVARTRWLGPPLAAWQRRLGGWLGLLLWLAVSAWVARRLWGLGWAVGALWAALAPLPTALLYVLVQRREMLRRRRRQAPVGPADASQGFVQAVRSTLAAGVLVLLVLGILMALPAWVFRYIGSAAVMMLFLSLTVQVLAGLQLLTRHLGGNVSGLGAAVVALLALRLVVGPGSEPLGTELLAQPAELAAVAPLPAATGAVLINARGGGLRAAVFTAEVLARADDASCGRFGQRVGGFSGVSGGSLGLATYLLARQARVADGGWGADCQPGQTAAGGPLTLAVREALLQDHLSPVLGRMATSDLLPFLPPRRGQALLDSWNDAINTTLKGRASLALPLPALTGGLPQRVPVYFNTTDADSGDIVWFSNLTEAPMGRPVNGSEGSPTRAMSVGQAVLHSARFPIVSPAGRLDGGPGCRIGDPPYEHPASAAQAAGHCRLVDGGYADNAGAITLRRRVGMVAGGLHVDLDGNPALTQANAALRPSAVPTALGALLRARSAHAGLASAEAAAGVGATGRSLHLQVAVAGQDTVTAPLGWYMSDEASKHLSASVRQAVESLCNAPQKVCAPP